MTAPPVDRLGAATIAVARWFELALAAFVLAGVVASAAGGLRGAPETDWTQPAAFERLISRVLLVAIGLELVRLLVVHSLPAMIELLAFAVARQVLAPGLSARDLFVGAAAFVGLLAAQRYLLRPPPPPADH